MNIVLFVDNKLGIHLGEDKTKCILFGTKYRLNKVSSSDIKMVIYTLSNITQCHILVAYWTKLFLGSQWL